MESEWRGVWTRFLEWIDSHSDSRWAFRGLGDNKFGQRPGIGRLPWSDARAAAARELAVLEIFATRAPAFERIESHSVWDVLALA